MNPTYLDTRGNKILAALINAYLATGEPVASKQICEECELGVSAATVRHILAELEEMGLLYQPHTSAGRTPTEQGYRYYVNSLIGPAELEETRKEEILRQYQEPETGTTIEQLIQKTGRILSETTHCVGIVRFPHLPQASVKELKLIPLGPDRVLVVLVTSSGLIKDSAVHLDKVFEEEILQLSRFLNAEIAGHRLLEAELLLSRQDLEEKDYFFYLRQRALAIIRQSHLFEEEERICLEGLGAILEEPEYQDPLRLKTVMEALEEKGRLLRVLEEGLETKEVKVQIGRENAWEEMEGLSIVSSSYWIGEEVAGSLGVVGPMRMDYPEIISRVKYIAEVLSRYLADAKEEI